MYTQYLYMYILVPVPVHIYHCRQSADIRLDVEVINLEESTELEHFQTLATPGCTIKKHFTDFYQEK